MLLPCLIDYVLSAPHNNHVYIEVLGQRRCAVLLVLPQRLICLH